jgi:hypothetical protein
MGSVFFFHLSHIKKVVEFNKKFAKLVVFILRKQIFPETSQFVCFFSTTVRHQIKTLIGEIGYGNDRAYAPLVFGPITLPTCLPTYLHMYLPTLLPAYLRTYVLAYTPTSLAVHRHFRLPLRVGYCARPF